MQAGSGRHERAASWIPCLGPPQPLGALAQVFDCLPNTELEELRSPGHRVSPTGPARSLDRGRISPSATYLGWKTGQIEKDPPDQPQALPPWLRSAPSPTLGSGAEGASWRQAGTPSAALPVAPAAARLMARPSPRPRLLVAEGWGGRPARSLALERWARRVIGAPEAPVTTVLAGSGWLADQSLRLAHRRSGSTPFRSKPPLRCGFPSRGRTRACPRP